MPKIFPCLAFVSFSSIPASITSSKDMYSVLQAWPILLTLACQVSADTYYIDSSCTNHKNWKDEIWTETQTLARRTLYRTNLGERDPNQLRALQLLWKVPAVASQNIQSACDTTPLSQIELYPPPVQDLLILGPPQSSTPGSLA